MVEIALKLLDEFYAKCKLPKNNRDVIRSILCFGSITDKSIRARIILLIVEGWYKHGTSLFPFFIVAATQHSRLCMRLVVALLVRDGGGNCGLSMLPEERRRSPLNII